jgi:hypothetical protein
MARKMIPINKFNPLPKGSVNPCRPKKRISDTGKTGAGAGIPFQK